MKRWQKPRRKKDDFSARPMPRPEHRKRRVRKRRATYAKRVVRRVEIMWSGFHDRGLATRGSLWLA